MATEIGIGRASVTVPSSCSSVERARGQLLVVPCFPRLFFVFWFFLFFPFGASLFSLLFPYWGGVLRSRHGAFPSSLPLEPTRFDVLDSWIGLLSHLLASSVLELLTTTRGSVSVGVCFSCSAILFVALLLGLISGIVLQRIEVERNSRLYFAELRFNSFITGRRG